MAAKNPYNLPTERIPLPSKGLPYPAEHILSQGYVDVVLPTAAQEDILTNSNYLDKGVAVDEYMKSILVTEVDLKDFLLCDKEALMINSRILGFGAKYVTYATTPKGSEIVTFNLSDLKERQVNWELFLKGKNEFSFTLPTNKSTVVFKLLTDKDNANMIAEEAGMRKATPLYSADTSLFLKYCLVEVNGARDTKSIREFVDRQMLQVDSRELKKYMISVTPGYIWNADGVTAKNEVVEGLFVPYTVDFFWPRY